MDYKRFLGMLLYGVAFGFAATLIMLIIKFLWIFNTDVLGIKQGGAEVAILFQILAIVAGIVFPVIVHNLEEPPHE